MLGRPQHSSHVLLGRLLTHAQTTSAPRFEGDATAGTISFRFFAFFFMTNVPWAGTYIPTYGTMAYTVKDGLVVHQDEVWDASFAGTAVTNVFRTSKPSEEAWRAMAASKLADPVSGRTFSPKGSSKGNTLPTEEHPPRSVLGSAQGLEQGQDPAGRSTGTPPPEEPPPMEP